ncbi:hypothetical protein OAD49_02350 [Flavobacteriaceae bacterium]|nr:hypothetical protein [Flavobacteriaceae bacterium]
MNLNDNRGRKLYGLKSGDFAQQGSYQLDFWNNMSNSFYSYKYFIPESHKVFIRITLILFSIVYLFFIGNRLYGYKFAKNQSPFGGGIYIAYYECLKCESLHGGIYGKGPTESMILDKECVHKWNAIEKKTFDKAYEFKTEKE